MSVRKPLLAGLLALALVATTAPGQPGAARGKTPATGPTFMTYAAMYLNNPPLHKELKLTDEQVKKVAPIAQGAMQRMFDARLDAKKRQEADQSLTKEVADVLDAGQLKRLREVTYQQLANIPVGGRILSEEPAFVKATALTDEQKARLLNREPLTAVLTDGQKAEYKKLGGVPFEERLTIGGAGFINRAQAPLSLRYLDLNPVQMDLKLAAGQKADVQKLKEKWTKEAAGRPFAGTGEERKKFDAQAAEFDKAARAVLDAGQAKRLDQIILRQNFTNGRESDVYTHKDIVAGVKLDAKQQAQVKAAAEERAKSLLAVLTADEDVAEVAKKVKAHKEETFKQLHTILTAEQQATLEGMLGEPFKGEIRLTPTFGGQGIASPFATMTVHLVTAGVNLYAAAPELHKELKLTEAQVKKLAELRAKMQAENSPVTLTFDEAGDKRRQEQATATEKALAGILTAEQLTRFKQLVLQTYTTTPTGRPATPARQQTLSRIDVVKRDIKLTEAQAKQLADGTAFEKVLDAGQLAKWRELLGPKFEGNLRMTAPSGFGGPARGPLPLAVQALQTKAVQEELKLMEAQLKALPEAEKKYQQEYAEAARNPNFEDFQKRRQAATKAFEAACLKLLDAAQAKRLEEVVLQHANRAGTNSLLLQPAALATVKLDEKQVERLTAVRDDNRQLLVLFRREFPQTRQGDAWVDREDVRQAQAALAARFQKKVEDVLTAEQKVALRQRLGQPFKGQIDTTRRPAFGGISFDS